MVDSSVTTALSSNSGLVIAGLIFVAAGGFLVAYLLYWAITKVAIDKASYMVPDTSMPVVGTSLTKSKNKVSIPPQSNGKRASFTFWIYVHDIDKYSGSRRHVLHVGEDSIDAASPVVYFSNTSNTLNVYFNPISDTSIPTNISKMEYLTSKYGITIDYIPIQRWVHVAVVVNETLNGGTISAYLDSDLVKVVTTGGDNKVPGYSNNTASIQNLMLDKSGNLVIGGSTSDSIGPGFSGLVSRFTVYNYDLNVSDIYNDYRIGPIDNLFAKLGLGAYGIQSPIYRIS